MHATIAVEKEYERCVAGFDVVSGFEALNVQDK